MAKGFTYKMEIDADINALTGKLKTLKEALASITSDGKEPKIAKILDQLGTRIDNIKTKAATPVKSEAAFVSMEKEIQNVQRLLESLGVEIGNVSKKANAGKISFLPEAEQKKLLAIVDAMKKYDSAIDTSTKKSKELLDAEKKLTAEEGKLEDAQKKLEATKKSAETAKDVRDRAKATLEAAQERQKEAKAAQEQYERIQKLAEARKKEAATNGEKVDLRSEQFDDGKGGKITLAGARGKAKSTASAAAIDDMNALSDAYKTAKANADALNTSIGTQTATVEKYQNSVNLAKDKVADLIKAFDANKLKASNEAFNDLRQAAKDLGINLEGIGADNTLENIDLLKQRMEEFVAQGVQPANEQLQQAINIIEQYRATTKHASETNEQNTETFREQSKAAGEVDGLMNRIKQFTGLAGAALVMRRSLRNAITTIKELDKQMTEMAVVTNLEVGDYWKQLPEHTERANALGMAIKDVYEAETLYYQQGLKTAQVTQLSTSTLKMARIAGLSAEDATNKMTAALRGFNMEINQTNADRIADVYSKLAAITASNVQEISTAMTKTASLAANAGMEFETTAAFLSQIIETTRESAETAGTALKTVIARFQELKKSPDEIGEIDGEIVDANKIEKALRTVGVSLRDAKGQFRSLDQVFLELSKKWDSLDTNTQRYIATIAAGSRQQSRFIAMMSNYARTQELVSAANNAAGASNEQFQKTLESLESKLAALKNAWDTFTMGIANNEVIKVGVDILTGLLDVINKVTGALGDGPGLIAKIALVTVALIAGDKALIAFKASMELNRGVIHSLGDAFQAMFVRKKADTIATEAETDATLKGASANAVYKMSMIEIVAIVAVVVAVIWGLVQAYKAIKAQSPEGKLEAAKEALESATKAADNAKEAFEGLKNSFSSLDDKYKALDELTVGTKEWRDAMFEVNQEVMDLIDKYPELNDALEVDANGVMHLNEQKKEQVLEEKRLIEAQAQSAKIAAKLNKSQAEANVEFSKLTNEAVAGNQSAARKQGANKGASAGAWLLGGLGGMAVGAAVGAEIAEQISRTENRDITNQFALALSEGKISGNSYTENFKYLTEELKMQAEDAEQWLVDLTSSELQELRKYGTTLSKNNKEQEAAMQSLISNASSLVDTTKYTTEQIQQINNIGIEAMQNQVKTSTDKLLEQTSDQFKASAEEYFSNVGEDVKIGKDGSVTYTVDDKEIELTKEQAIAQMGAADATEVMAKRMEALPKAFATISQGLRALGKDAKTAAEGQKALNKAFKDTQGASLSRTDITNLSKDMLESMWDSNLALQEAYPNMQEFFNEMEKRTKLATQAFTDNAKELKRLGLESVTLDQTLSSGAEKGLIEKLSQIVAVSGEQGGKEAVEVINKLLNNVSNEDREKVVSSLNAIDWHNLNELEELPNTLKELRTSLPTNAIQDFTSKIKELAHSVYTTDLSKINETILSLQGLSKKIKTGEQGRFFDEKDYELITKNNSELMKYFVKDLDGKYFYLGTRMEILTEAIDRNTLVQGGDARKVLQADIEIGKFLKDISNGEFRVNGGEKLSTNVDVIRGLDSTSQKGFLKLFLENYTGDLTGLKYLSEGTSIDVLSEDQVKEIIEQLFGIKNNYEDNITKLMLEGAQTTLATLLDDNIYETAKILRKSVTNTDEATDYIGARNSVLLQAQAAGLSDAALYDLSFYNAQLVKLEEAGKIGTETYEEMKEKFDTLAEDIINTTAFTVMLDGIKDNVKGWDDLIKKYKEATEEQERRVLVNQMLSKFGIAATEKNFEGFSNLINNLLQGDEEAFEKIINAVVGQRGITEDILNGQEVYDALEGQYMSSLSTELLNYATFLQSQNLGYIDFDNKFHFATDQIINYINAVIEAEEKWINPYDYIYNLNQQINGQIRERERLEWEYSRAVLVSANNVETLNKNLIAQANTLENEVIAAYNGFLGAQKELQDLFNKLENSKFLDYISFGSNGEIYINYEGEDKFGPAFKEFVDSIQAASDNMFDYASKMRSAISNINQLKYTGRDEYIDIIHQIADGLEKQYQAEIDKLSNINDAINDASEKLVSKIQEKIDDDRSARELDKAEKSLEDKRAQLAYLQAGGGNTLDILKLQKEIGEEEQSLQDRYVDNAISELEKSNQLAADQRQTQIEIANAQLQWWKTNESNLDAEELFKSWLTKGSEVTTKYIIDLIGETNLTETEKNKLLEDVTSTVNSASIWEKQTVYGHFNELEQKLVEQYNEILGKIAGLSLGNGKGEETTSVGSVLISAAQKATSIVSRFVNGIKSLFVTENPSDEATKDVDIPQGQTTDYAEVENKVENVLNTPESISWLQDFIDHADYGQFKEEDRSDWFNDYQSITGDNFTGEDRDRAWQIWKNLTEDQKASIHGEDWSDDSKDFGDYSVAELDPKEPQEAPTLEFHSFGAKLVNGGLLGFQRWDWNDARSGKEEQGYINYQGQDYAGIIKGANAELGSRARENGISDGELFYLTYNGNTSGLYGYYDNYAFLLKSGSVDKFKEVSNAEYATYFPLRDKTGRYRFATGGLADFTGPAWLDGTKSAPELVLNATDTANFIQLKDILSEIMRGASDRSSDKTLGNNYYTIDVHVDSIESDYDIDQATEHIKELIEADAMYRNVNAVERIR